MNKQIIEISSSQSPDTSLIQELQKKISEDSQKTSIFETIDHKIKSLIDLEEMLKDDELKHIAMEERTQLIDQINSLESEMIEILLPKIRADEANCTLEIKHAMGGSESSLFAEDLMRMYQSYASLKGWQWQQLKFVQDTSIGKGCKQALIKIRGQEVFGHLKHERGVHKVQRVPETEKTGRMHSSTCIIIVMPEIPMDFKIDPKDL